MYKKRLNKNMHRSIILAKCGTRWVYGYLFAKNERDNMHDDEVLGYKKLAKGYAKLTHAQLGQLIVDQDLVEICHGIKENQSEERSPRSHA